jgi:hypothetical protein
MSAHDLFKDPYFAQLAYVIERCICKADRAAQEKSIRLTDSNIKSALNKARRIDARDMPAPLERVQSREDFIDELAGSIAANRRLLEVDGGEEGDSQPCPVPLADWVKAISAVEASLKIRRSSEPGSRDYLDYVHGFVEQGAV